MDWLVSVARAVDQGRLPDWILKQLEQAEFCATESACLDFKRDSVGSDATSVAETVKDILSFHNTYGGFIVFGVAEVEKDVRYRPVGIGGTPFNMQELRGKVTSYASAEVPFTYEEVSGSGGVVLGVICIPKRPRGARPNTFRKRGPEIKPGKFAFDAGSVAIRRADSSTLASELADWQLVLSDRVLDSVAGELGLLLSERKSGAALDHNLPSRAVICARFVGRSDVLTKLWAWLSDRFQYAKVIAGEGGKGKTSVAYEFATQVAYVAPLNISRVLWLTAKRQQFSGIENTWKRMPQTHFACFQTLLVAIGKHLGYEDDELAESSEAQLREMVMSEIAIQPTLFVLDDIDSLPLDDQRKTLEFAQQAGSESVRFLLTTRSNASYSSAAAITLGGLIEEDYRDLIDVLVERYKMTLPKGAAEELQDATQGSPLLTDSILRVVRRGYGLRKAIDEWRGHSGEDARDAVLGREIAQLSREAQRVLLCLAFLGQCSKTELMRASGVLEYRMADALEELQSLFIVSAPKIIESEPRFEIGITTALLVVSKRSELAGDHVAIEKAIREARSKAKAGASPGHNKAVAIAISQALALLKDGNTPAALATVEAALKSQKNNPDLLSFKARVKFDEKTFQSREDARKLFALAYEHGARKHILFDLWYKAERDAAFGPGVVDVSDLALKEFPSEEALWSSRRAEGYILTGLVRVRNREFDQAFDELTLAAKELQFALKKASESERQRMLEFLHGVHDEQLAILPNTTNSSRSDAVSMIREMTDRGDVRFSMIALLASALVQRAGEIAKMTSGQETHKDRFEQNRQYVLDLLRNAGIRGAELGRQVSQISLR